MWPKKKKLFSHINIQKLTPAYHYYLFTRIMTNFTCIKLCLILFNQQGIMLKYLRDNTSEVDTSYVLQLALPRRGKLQVDDVTFNNADRTHSAGFAVNSNITNYRYMYMHEFNQQFIFYLFSLSLYLVQILIINKMLFVHRLKFKYIFVKLQWTTYA